ncbi:hypothetical protein HDU98_011763 [Podochytrium sp. JEL0797]|nr:hypothetical protein HDU98_011763 [Podochytrium sp. JEL0797]
MHRVASDCTLQESDSDDVCLFDLDFAGPEGVRGGGVGLGGTFQRTGISFSEESERFEEEDGADAGSEGPRFESGYHVEEDERWESDASMSPEIHPQALHKSRDSGYYGDAVEELIDFDPPAFEPPRHIDPRLLSFTHSLSTLTITTEEDWRDDDAGAFESVAEYASRNALEQHHQSSSSPTSTKWGTKMRSLVIKSRRDDELVFVDL